MSGCTVLTFSGDMSSNSVLLPVVASCLDVQYLLLVVTCPVLLPVMTCLDVQYLLLVVTCPVLLPVMTCLDVQYLLLVVTCPVIQYFYL